MSQDSETPIQPADNTISELDAALDGFKQATENVRLRLASRKRLDAVDSLVITHRDKRVMTSLAHVCRTALGTRVAFVTMLDDSIQYMLAAAGATPINCPVEDSLCQYVIGHQKTSQMMHLQDNEELAGDAYGIEGFDSYLGAPWTYNGEVIGSFCVLGTNEEWTSRDIATIETCAAEISKLVSA